MDGGPVRLSDDYGPTVLGLLLAFALVGTAILVAGMGLAFIVPSASCDTQWSDFTHRFEFIGGCLIQYEGTWYPDDVLRTVLRP